MRHPFLVILASLAGLVLCGSANALVPDLRQLDALPMHSLSTVAVAKSVTIASAQPKSAPYQFAVSAPLALGLADGVWQTLDASTSRWRARVFSSGAQSLSFEFAQFNLPTGGELWIYDARGKRVEGPYTAANRTSDGKLWTAVVPGDTAIIEVRVPTTLRDQLQLQLAQVHHGFRGFDKASTGSFGTSGACEVDVVCPLNDGSSWPAQARSVARITINNNTLCSGQLVNNVRQDNTPYFLTANHCGITTEAIANSLVFYWNYQNSVCGGNGTEPSYQTQNGSSLVAGDQGSDFTLVKLTQAPAAAINAYLAGWDAANDTPQSGAVLHHPMGDVRKIATFSQPLTRKTATLCVDQIQTPACVNQRTVSAWEVFYSQGITEPGSSGAGLYNQNRQLVGQLSGGNSACNGNNGNGQSDIYGRMDVAWTANAAASGQLKASLDPDNSGTLRMSGKEFNAAAGSSSGASGGGGGGALPLSSLIALASLGWLRRKRRP